MTLDAADDDTRNLPLEQAIALLAGAGLDVSVVALRDALWLATQAEIRFETPRAQHPDGPAASPQTTSTPAPQVPAPSSPRAPRAVEPVAPADDSNETVTDQTGLYPGGQPGSSDSIRASPIRVPAGAALPGRLPLLRAFRPFTERWPSRRAEELDEEATADATAEQGGRLAIRVRQRPERWYQAELVVEDAPSMDIWHETLAEFETLMRETGAFRDVRKWRLRFVPEHEKPDRLQPELWSASGARMSPAGLASKRARPLILLATHGISPRWLDSSMGRMLVEWSQHASVVILHLLPRDLWTHTALGEPGALVHALVPGTHTERLEVEQFVWDWFNDTRRSVAVPIVSLDPDACSIWALMQMARGRRTPAALIPIEEGPPATGKDEEPPAEQMVALLRSHGSSFAFRLAVYLSPGPFTLPVARLIQAAKFGAQAQQSQLAELFLSGLMRRLTPLETDVHPDWVQYDIREDARPILLRSLTEEDAQAVLDTLQAHVGRYVERTFGKPADFRALIRDASGQFDLPAWAQPFATIGSAIVRMQNAHASSDVRRRVPGAAKAARDVRRDDPRVALEQYFGEERVAAALGSDAKKRKIDLNRLIAVAVALLPDEHRERLAVLSVVRGPMPRSLWSRLLPESDLVPLREIGAVQEIDGRLNRLPALRNELTKHARTGAPELHQRIVDAYQTFLPDKIEDDGYHYQYYLKHAGAANDIAAAVDVLFDPSWLTQKVETVGYRDLLEDLTRFADDDSIRALEAVIRRRKVGREVPSDWAKDVLREFDESGTPDDAKLGSRAPDGASSSNFSALVLGTGLQSVGEFERSVAISVATRLAQMQVRLLVGPGPGIDTIMSDAYAAAIQAQGGRPEGSLIRFAGRRQALFAGSTRVVAAEDWHLAAFAEADVVILIGGRAGRFAREARARGISVIPIAASGGAARDIFKEIVERGDLSEDDVLATAGAGPPAPSVDDASVTIAQRVAELIEHFRQPDVTLRRMASEYLAERNIESADALEQQIMATLVRHPEYASVNVLMGGDDDVAQVLEAFRARVWPDGDVINRLLRQMGAMA